MTANGETYIENIYSDELPASSSTASSSTAPRPTSSASLPCARTPCRLSSTRGTPPTVSGFRGSLCAGGSGQGRRAAHNGRLWHDFRPRPRTHVRLPFRGSGPFHQGAVAGDRRGPGWLLRRGLRRLHPPQDEAPRDR